ncbi:MAG: aminotransferase class I/II-fold pyridoxal phosphate-dependent enzyme [Acidobacteriota bacterium]
MPTERLQSLLETELAAIAARGTAKRNESVVVRALPPSGDQGPRVLLAGEGDKPFLKMNSNSYLGLSRRPELLAAEEHAARAFGAGPGAVRFISGTHQPHVDLERRLAEFHRREAGMIFSAAYATVLSVILPLVTAETAIVSDELNHNCIINAIRLSRPKDKQVYKHLDLRGLEAELEKAADSGARRCLVVTDGIFSMRGDHAPLAEIFAIARRWDERFPENVITVVDDSHGVGAFGKTGRGTEEATGSGPADVLVATLGKALGVNGGYVVGSRTLLTYFRETSPMYIYSNPITPSEAAAAAAALAILDSAEGRRLLEHLRAMTSRFEQGLVRLGFETIPGEHPVVPLMVRDTARTQALVAHLRHSGILATGLAYPVVPRGDEEIRFQINADMTPHDVDFALGVLERFAGR